MDYLRFEPGVYWWCDEEEHLVCGALLTERGVYVYRDGVSEIWYKINGDWEKVIDEIFTTPDEALKKYTEVNKNAAIYATGGKIRRSGRKE